jgi:hypothetical protein
MPSAAVVPPAKVFPPVTPPVEETPSIAKPPVVPPTSLANTQRPTAPQQPAPDANDDLLQRLFG